jgi:hypothetical protein
MRSLSFDVAFGSALSEEFQAALGKTDNFSLIVIVRPVTRLDLAVCNQPDHVHDIVGLADEADQLLVLRLEQLKQGPDGNVLESWIAARQVSAQVSVDAVAWLRPMADKDGVVTNCERVC